MKKMIMLIMMVLAFVSSSFTQTLTTTTTTAGGGGSNGPTEATPVVICPQGYICGPVSAISPPASVPLTTPLLKAYALTKVDHINGQAWAPSVSGGQRYFNVGYPVGHPDEKAMAAVAKRQPILFTVDPVDEVQTSLQYRGTIMCNNGGYDYELFAGHWVSRVEGSAFTHAFNFNLTVGSEGEDVSALQTILISLGFEITGLTNKGNFGQSTLDAVRRYQTSVGTPSTGFVGPLTRASLNAISVGVWRLPPTAYKFSLQLSDWIPFPVPGISSATMEYTDGNGNKQWYNFDDDGRIDRNCGIIILGHKHLDKSSGRLFLDYRDGTKVVYDLVTGQERPTVSTQPGYFDPSIDGIRTVRVSEGIESKAFITVSPADEVINLIADSPVLVILTYTNTMPTAVYAIDSVAFASNPQSVWTKLPQLELENGSNQFSLEAGRDILLRFERETPKPVPGGKG